MIILESILNQFNTKYELHQCEEVLELLTISATFDSIAIPSPDQLASALSKIKTRDSYTLDVVIGDNDPIDLYSTSLDIPAFLMKLVTGLGYKETDDSITIKISVYKKKEKHSLSIYCFDVFYKGVLKLNLKELTTLFACIASEDPVFVFQLLDGAKPFGTRMFRFHSDDSIVKSELDQLTEKRASRTDSMRKVCHYGNAANDSLIPDDFKLVSKSSDGEVNKLFDRLCLMYCLIFISDITSMKDKSISIKLNGYRSILEDVLFDENLGTSSAMEFFQIYDWIYEGGNLSDKTSLARNIISIHVPDRVTRLTGLPFYSIQSGFEIYLKEHVKQYIEIKKNLSDQILTLTEKANKIVDDFASNFQKSILTFLSFFTSVVVIRVLTTKDFVNIITKEAAILCGAFLVLAIIFLIFSTWEVRAKRKRFVNGYGNLKMRYKDLLVEKDLERILNNDRDFNDDVKFIDAKKRQYVIMWILSLCIFLIAILFLTPK